VENVSASFTTRRLSPVTFLCRQTAHNLAESRALTRNGIASAFWKWPRRRDALLKALYRTEVEKLAAAEQEFAQALPPMEALRAWMLLFVDYIAAKQIIAPALNALVGGPSKVIEASYAPIHKAARARVEGRYQGRRHTETSTQSIYCELLSASLTRPPAPTGSKAPEVSWISSLPVRDQSHRPW
jgi:hypothetical protein